MLCKGYFNVTTFLFILTMKKILNIVSYILIVAGVLAASSFYFAEDFYHKMVAEDGPFEDITAIVLLLMSVLFFIRFFKNKKTKNIYWLLLCLLIAIGSFFGFGEEISWGQRIFSVQSNDFFMQNNLQGETNLHNLEVGGVKLNKLIFSQGLVIIFGFYFVAALILYRKWGPFKKLVDRFGVQIPKFKHTVTMLVCTGLILFVPDRRIWELWEAIFVVILLLVFMNPYNSKETILN